MTTCSATEAALEPGALKTLMPFWAQYFDVVQPGAAGDDVLEPGQEPVDELLVALEVLLADDSVEVGGEVRVGQLLPVPVDQLHPGVLQHVEPDGVQVLGHEDPHTAQLLLAHSKHSLIECRGKRRSV